MQGEILQGADIGEKSSRISALFLFCFPIGCFAPSTSVRVEHGRQPAFIFYIYFAENALC